MKRYIIFLSLVIVTMFAHAEQWRLHPTFDGKIDRIVDTPDYTYILSLNKMYDPGVKSIARKSMSLFRYDKTGEEFQWLSQGNLLSDNLVQQIEYNPDERYLMAVYDNGDIDLIYDSGEVANIPGFKLSGSEYSKNVNGITFSNEKKEAYIATDFGFIVVNDSRKEITGSYMLDKKLTSVAVLDGKFVMCSSDGILEAPYGRYIDSEDITQVSGFSDVKSISPFKARLYVLCGENSDMQLQYLTSDNGILTPHQWLNGKVLCIERRKDGLLVCVPESVICVDDNYETVTYRRVGSDNKMAGWSGNEFWLDRERSGLSLMKAERSQDGETSWTTLKESLIPNASNAYKSTNMVYHPDYGMLVRNNGVDERLGDYDEWTPDLICSYRNFEWQPRSATYLAPSEAFIQWNPGGVAIDPRNKNHVYSGSVLQGLMRLDLENPANSLRLGREGEGAARYPRYIPILPDRKGWIMNCPFSFPVFDRNGVLWTSWYDFDLAQAQKDAVEFWFWTPEDRLASKDAASYRPLKKMKISGLDSSPNQKLTPLMSQVNNNLLLYVCRFAKNGIYLHDHKGTLENEDDDEHVTVAGLIDQDGQNVDFAYFLSMYEEPETGLIWMGTDNGVFTFRPRELMKNGGRVNKIKVARNDGTNLADYLLDGANVNCIITDKVGRKWFATNGGIVITSPAGTEVIRSYTSENSELPDNTVYEICYNPENNSMMLSTDKGLAELFLSDSSVNADSDNKAVAYPNPVRPDYFGYVTVTGLSDNALVKVVDAGGNLIKELGFSAGGEARWDVTNLNSKRVPGGVYYILASGGPDSDSFSAVTKVLVVN